MKIHCSKTEVWPLGKFVPHPRNPNKHPANQIALLGKIITAQGWRSPICVSKRSGFVIKGHGRLAAAMAAGLKEAPVDLQDYATEADEWADMIADNRLAELAEIDLPQLKDLLQDLDTGEIDMDLTGFDADALADMMLQEHQETDEDADAQTDKAEELREKWGVELGQLWQLGEHRILCGDSTKTEDVKRALCGDVPGLMVTDPPYGIEYDPSWRAEAGVNKNKDKMGKVENDDKADWTAAWLLFPGDAAYVYHADRFSSVVLSSLETAGFKPRAQIIWAKDRMALGRGDYHWQHEPCWYVVREGKAGHRNDDRTQTTLWQIPARDDAGHGHGTQKPVECMARPIRNHEPMVVYEPFSGSGTTIIACEQLGRKCRAIEISPAYVAVAIQRWHDATGKDPVKLS